MKNIFASKKQKNQFIFILAALLALLAVIALLISFDSHRKAEALRQAEQLRIIKEKQTISGGINKISVIEQSETSSHLIAGNNALLIEQQEVGFAVIVNTLILDQPGFIGIYSADKDLLNTSPLLPRGLHRIVSIAVPETLETNTSYMAAIHPDIDGSKTFDEADIALENNQGEVIFAEFSAIVLK